MSTQSSLVQHELEPMLPPAAALGSASASANLKQQVAERLAAHRARRRSPAPTPGPVPVRSNSNPRGRASEIASAVAERYANSPTYRATLAAQIEEAIQQANAAAQVAAVTAEAVAAAQYSLLAEIDQLAAQANAPDPVNQPSPSDQAFASFFPEPADAPRIPEPEPARAAQPAPIIPLDPSLLTVRLIEEIGRQPFHHSFVNDIRHLSTDDEELQEEVQAMEEEIAFRHAPVFGDLAPVHLPANLIEFPRELIAPRKARPRLAEGPLLADGSPDPSQLRIFEVQPEHISPAPALDDSAPVWSSIVLGRQPEAQPFEPGPFAPVPAASAPIYAAQPRLRATAALIDASVIAASTALFAAVFVYTAGSLHSGSAVLSGPSSSILSGLHLLLDSWKSTALGLGGSTVLLAVLYHTLCFTLSDATFGMRRTRIALCTFHEQNPRRGQRLAHLAASAASLSFLGLGLLWLYIDTDNLTLHDRLTKAYPRSY